jgi:outer membrane protein assembly factor BamB
MLRLRRVSLVVVVAGILAALPALLVPEPAVGQLKQPQPKQPPPKDPEVKPGAQFSAVKLVENDRYQKTIDDAIDAINDGAWQDAVDHLQELLDAAEDYYVRVETIDPKSGQKKIRRISAKVEANNLLAKLPAVGRATYEDTYGLAAKKRLDEYIASGNREILAECAQKYQQTKAGQVANELLATSLLDRGDYFIGALRYEQLIGPDPAKSKVSDLVIFKATLAFTRAGETKKAEEFKTALFKRMEYSGSLKLHNGQVATINQVKAILAAVPPPSIRNPHDWPLVGGNLPRNAQAKGSPPMLDQVIWMRPTIQDKSDELGEVDAGAEAKDWLNKAIDLTAKMPNTPVMPGGFPIATNGLLIYRTYNGITAVYLKDQLDKDGNVESKAGSVAFKSTPFEGGLANAMAVPGAYTTLTAWIAQSYDKSGFSNLVFENSTVGTLTTDNRNVYAIDDLAIPAPPKYLMPQFWSNPKFVDDTVKPLVEQNALRAFSINSGKIEWNLGGFDANKTDEFAKTHFICTPIAVGGKLYVLNEKNNGDLRLLCLDPATGKALSAPQKLGTVKNEHLYFKDIARRASAIHLAYGEGILVCPTNAGEILGVDLLSRTLAWAYPYRQKSANPAAFPKQFEQFPYVTNIPIALSYSNWKVSPPVIVDGKVVFTAPDASAIHCINLRDGTELWKSPQNDTDLYFAGVFGDKAIIVGKNSVRALRLADGAPMWDSLQTGDLPSGQGVASNNFYYVPLKKGEILKIDIARWSVIAHNKASKTTGMSPGNLVFYEGMVLSQTPTAVVAYPQLTAKLEEVEIAYKKNPTPSNLLLRGELRLADGQVQRAVDDLVAVLADKNAQGDIVKRAKSRLYEALTDLLQTDFDKTAGKYLKDYQDLCKVPDNPQEELQRTAKYHYVVAVGREAQGDLVSAFLAYREFGASPLYRDDGVPSVDDPLYKVPTHLWLRGRIGAMFEKGTAAQKKALEDKIAEEWLSVKNKGEIDGIRQFTAMFDVPFAVGREARLEMANVIMQKPLIDAYLEAEMNLQQLRVPMFKDDPVIGGKALEALARLEIAKGSDNALRLAAAYYREIYKDYAKVVLRNGKTGADLFNAVVESPLLRPFMEEPGIMWANAEFKHREVGGGVLTGIQGFAFQPEGDVVGPMQGQRLVLELNQNNPVLRLVDSTANKERWTSTLGAEVTNDLFFRYMFDQMGRPTGFYPNAKYRYYQVKGHLAVVQVGMMVYGVDMDGGKVLWKHELYDTRKPPPQTVNPQLMTDDKGRFWVVHQNQFGGSTKVRVGQVGAVQPTYVALTTPKGLLVLDPLKGTTLWSKPGLTGNIEVFGDDQYIYYVEAGEGGGAVGAGRCLRASDGALVDIPDFGFYYRHQLRIIGRQILTAEPGAKALTMRLYDVHTGKDLWKRTFENDPVALMTEDPNLCGVIEKTSGKLIVIDLRTFKEVLDTNVKQFRIGDDDLKELHQPWLVEDNERFYVALNTKFSSKLIGNMVSNNFDNSTRCIPVNGWFCAFDKKGEFVWHSHDRYVNQMLVTEHFKTLPILLFTARFQELLPNGGVRNVSRTGSVNKASLKLIWWSPERETNGAAQFYAFNIDLRAGTINMIGHNGSVQFYMVENGQQKK